MKKIEHKEIEQRYKDKGLILIDSYNKWNDKLTSIDNDGYYYYFSSNKLSRFTNNIKAKVSKGNPYSLQNINHYMELHNIPNKAIAVRWDKKPYIKLQCECNNEYEIPWQYVLSGKNIRYCCNECKKNIHSSKKYSFNFVKQTLKNNGYILLENEYKSNSDNLLCLNKDGYRVYVKFTNIINNYSKEPYVFSIKFNKLNYIYNVNHYFKINNIDCKALSYTLQKDIPILHCKCSCGNNFDTNFYIIKKGSYRCYKCLKRLSNFEYKVAQWLDKKHIVYEMQKKFQDCKVKKPLPFDFYLPKYNCCIEVDGQQHYQIVNFNKINEKEQINNLKQRQEYDKIKTQYCQDNNIKLIRIKYNQIEKRHTEYKKILYDNLIKK